MEKNKNQKEHGITLIALIVTIIVLMILAGISILLVAQNQGIFKRASYAVDVNNIATEKEQVDMKLQEHSADYYDGKYVTKQIEHDVQKGDWIYEQCKEKINRTNDYEFSITLPENGLEVDETNPYFIVILRNNKLREPIKGTLSVDGTLIWGTEKSENEEKDPTITDTDPTYICVGLKDGVLSYYCSVENAKANNPDVIYEKISEIEFFVNWNGTQNNIPWKDEKIERVIIEDEISPLSTAYYFCGLTDVKQIEKIENLKTDNVTSMLKMFFNCTSLEEVDLSGFDTKSVVTMDSMFANCTKLKEVDLSRLDTSKVTNMNCMFQACKTLRNLDLTSLDTGSVTQMAYMFQQSDALTSLDLTNFDTKNVTNMNCMFFNCTGLNVLDLSSFDVSQVTTMTDMFKNVPTDLLILANKATKTWLEVNFPTFSKIIEKNETKP